MSKCLINILMSSGEMEEEVWKKLSSAGGYDIKPNLLFFCFSSTGNDKTWVFTNTRFVYAHQGRRRWQDGEKQRQVL